MILWPCYHPSWEKTCPQCRMRAKGTGLTVPLQYGKANFTREARVGEKTTGFTATFCDLCDTLYLPINWLDHQIVIEELFKKQTWWDLRYRITWTVKESGVQPQQCRDGKLI